MTEQQKAQIEIEKMLKELEDQNKEQEYNFLEEFAYD